MKYIRIPDMCSFIAKLLLHVSEIALFSNNITVGQPKPFPYEVTIRNREWTTIETYRHPSVDNKPFMDITTKPLSAQYEDLILIGYLNYYCLERIKVSTLFDLCDIFYFKILQNATCFMKTFSPSPVDVILTNNLNSVLVFLISDVVSVAAII